MIHTIMKDNVFEKFSRFEAEFLIQDYLGAGAFGDALKVKWYIDNIGYAIKRVKLRTPCEFKNAKEEAHTSSILKHKNIVQYIASWTEIIEESVFNSYKPSNENYMDVE